MSLFGGIGDFFGDVFGGLFGTGENSTSNSFLNTEGDSGSPLSMVTDPSGWWDNFKNGQATARNNKTNDTNKAIADDLNASNERIANATNDANLKMNETNNKTNLDIANATNQANIDIANSTNKANLDIANQNINFQKETNAKNEQLMREQWAREDNAYSRTVQDMRNSGINPLAMNSTNGAGSVVSQTAPQNTATMQGATMQGATMNAGHIDPWTKVGWTADYNIANDLSDFGLLTQLAGTLANLGGVAHQKQAQDKSASQTDVSLAETERHNKASENSLSTKYDDVKNVVKEATSDIKGIVDAQGGVNEIVSKASDLAVETANRIYQNSGIGKAVEGAKNKVAEKQKEMELKKQSQAVEEYRKKMAEEKKKSQNKAFKEYKKNYYNDSALNESYISNSIRY